MTFIQSYIRISSRFLNKFVEPRLERFKRIHKDLKMANFGVMFREYISACFFSAILAFIISLPVSFLLLYFLFSKTLLFSVLVSLGITAALTVGLFAVLIEYPATRVNERKRSIDNNLPFAALYMNTISGTGAPPHLMFKLLSDFKEYGEVSVEAQSIVEDVEVMGQDIEVALQRAAERSPSVEFKDLLWGMVTTIVRGGDLRSLLQEKSNLLMEDYRRRMDQYTNDLTMYVEIYITLVIVGSIFSIVMLTIMGAISGFQALKAVQQVMVYVFLPLASIFFIMLLKLTSPVSA